MKRFTLLFLFAAFSMSSCLDKLAESPSDSDGSPESSEAPEKPGDSDEKSGTKTSSSSASKPKKRSFTEIREERKALEKRLEELNALTEGESALITEELDVTEKLTKLRNYHGAAQNLHDELAASMEAWKNATRKSFIGVQLPEVTTTDGRSFQSVTIQKVDDDKIIIGHNGGSETLEIIQLPAALRKNVLHEATVLATREE